MHSYATNARDREQVAALIAVPAIIVSLLTSVFTAYLREQHKIEVPWWFDTPAVLGWYAAFYGLYDRWLWRARFWRVGFSNVPDVRGTWVGSLKSSYQNTEIPLMITVHQTWTRISIQAGTENSNSYSTMAALNTNEVPEAGLKYEYLNEPGIFGADTLNTHRGNAHLRVSSSGKEMEGTYFTGRGRGNLGAIRVERVSRDILDKRLALQTNQSTIQTP